MLFKFNLRHYTALLKAKRAALGLKRAGDVDGAKAALRTAKAHQAELEETRALLT